MRLKEEAMRVGTTNIVATTDDVVARSIHHGLKHGFLDIVFAVERVKRFSSVKDFVKKGDSTCDHACRPLQRLLENNLQHLLVEWGRRDDKTSLTS